MIWDEMRWGWLWLLSNFNITINKYERRPLYTGEKKHIIDHIL